MLAAVSDLAITLVKMVWWSVKAALVLALLYLPFLLEPAVDYLVAVLTATPIP